MASYLLFSINSMYIGRIFSWFQSYSHSVIPNTMNIAIISKLKLHTNASVFSVTVCCLQTGVIRRMLLQPTEYTRRNFQTDSNPTKHIVYTKTVYTPRQKHGKRRDYTQKVEQQILVTIY